MFLGKIIGGLVGYFCLATVGWGPVGVFIGIALGHYFDKGRASLEGSFNPQVRAEIEAAFKNTLFPILGMLSKADGRVCENEISSIEKLMQELGIRGEDREGAIAAFQSGVAGEQSLEVVLEPFISVTGRRRELHQIFLTYLLSIAFADGELHESEERLLIRIAGLLGYSRFSFNRLVGMVKAQSYFYQRQSEQAESFRHAAEGDALEKAYAAIGVNDTATDAELKRAYRKLMSEYHPDKLAGKGVPEEMLKEANERTQEIQSAYELIKKARQK